MNFEDLLTYRISIGINYLAREYENVNSILHKLHIISLLPKEYDVKNKIDDMSKIGFSIKNGKSLLFNQQSLTVWNALFSIVLLKNNFTEEAELYLKTVIDCIDDKYIRPSALISDNKSTSNNGKILLSVLYAFEKTGNNLYLDVSKKIAYIMLSQIPKYDHYDLIGLCFLNKNNANQLYENRINYIYNDFNNIETSSMTSLVASMTQQVLIHINKPSQELLDYQMSLQIDSHRKFGLDIQKYEGGFIQNMRNMSVRHDFAIQNIYSFLQYRSPINSIGCSI